MKTVWLWSAVFILAFVGSLLKDWRTNVMILALCLVAYALLYWGAPR